MFRKILITLALGICSVFNAQAGLVILKNFDLIWYEGTDEHGGAAKIVDLDGWSDPFQVYVSDFSTSYNWIGEGAPPEVYGFLTEKGSDGVSFDPWLLFIDRVKFPDQWNISAIGTGYDKYPGIPFSVTEFRQAYWQVDDSRITSSVPEPATWLLSLIALMGLAGASKKAALPKQVR